MINANCDIFHLREPYGTTQDFESHDFYELYVFIDGNVTYYIEEKMYILVDGDIMLIPPGKMHRPVIVDPNSAYERIVVWVNPFYLNKIDEDKSILEGLKVFESKRNYLIHPGQEDFEYMKNLLAMLIEENQSHPFGNQLMTQSLISMLFIQFIRHSLHPIHQTPPPEVKGIVPDIIRYINDNLAENLSLDNLSEQFFISKYCLLKEFKCYTHATVYDYIISKRIIAAKKMIHQGSTASEACHLSGFADYSNFYKSFIKKTGLTPKKFKQLIQVTRRTP